MYSPPSPTRRKLRWPGELASTHTASGAPHGSVPHPSRFSGLPRGRSTSATLWPAASHRLASAHRSSAHFLVRPTRSDEEQAFFVARGAGDVDEGVYCVVRNHVLAKWRGDVTRVLSEEQARLWQSLYPIPAAISPPRHLCFLTSHTATPVRLGTQSWKSTGATSASPSGS